MKKILLKVCVVVFFLSLNIFLITGSLQAADIPLQCETCHGVHIVVPGSTAPYNPISFDRHEVMMIKNPGCTPECHPDHGGYPPPGATTNVCILCHPSTGGAHPTTTIIKVGISYETMQIPVSYETIQTAVNLTTPGKTINVLAGTYNENVTINKSLTLSGAGANQSLVTAFNTTDDVFEVSADSVTISGFSIGGATGNGNSGINMISSPNNCTVSQNNISGNHYGIYANTAVNCTISNNTIDSNIQNGITLINGSVNNTVQGNDISNNGLIPPPPYPGGPVLPGFGIVLNMNCSNNTLTGNTLFNNGYGLKINVFAGWDVSNIIYHNNFIGNLTQVSDGNPADNLYYSQSLLEGNYWFNYNGEDDGSGDGKHAISGDGIGDSIYPFPSENFDFYPFIAENEWNNAAPILNPIGDKSVNENELLTFIVSGSDQESADLTYTAEGLPSGAVFDCITRTFSWTPDYNQAGTYSVTFEVSDGVKTDSETITITVNNVPIPPNPPSNLTATRNRTMITLNWIDNSNNESGFKIERKVNARASWIQIKTVNANEITYIDTTGKKGYSYRVRAYNADGDSDYSNTVTVK